MIKKVVVYCIALLVTVAACKSSKKEKEESFFPVLSFLLSQVANVDTSLYSIIKLNYIDSVRTDTEYVRREDFRGLARDFLEIPDLSNPKLQKRFREEKTYDESMGRVILTYLPQKAENEQLQRQEVTITPSPAGDHVSSIYINLLYNSRDSSVEKKLLWQADRSFQVVIIKQLPGKPEAITTTKVSWNEPAEQ